MKKPVKTTETPLPVVLRKNRWYNTITKKYVSKAYARRINAYFRKHPEKTLLQARGHAFYDKEESMVSQHKIMKELAYKTGVQVIKTRSRKGKTVYLSPFTGDIIDESALKSLKKLDYTICSGTVDVSLYRKTRSGEGSYHILTTNVYQRLATPNSVRFFAPEILYIYYSMLKEATKLVKKHSLGHNMFVYGRVVTYVYSDIDGHEWGIYLKTVDPHKGWQSFMKKDFKSRVLDQIENRLEMDAYRNIMFQTLSLYIWGSVKDATEMQKEKMRYRVGVTNFLDKTRN